MPPLFPTQYADVKQPNAGPQAPPIAGASRRLAAVACRPLCGWGRSGLGLLVLAWLQHTVRVLGLELDGVFDQLLRIMRASLRETMSDLAHMVKRRIGWHCGPPPQGVRGM